MKHMAQMSVVLTGTGIPAAAPGRAGPGTMVRVGEDVYQFDAGRATTLRLSEAGVQTDELTALLLTHHHSDHCVDVPDTVISRWILGGQPLPILAPQGPFDAFGAHLLDVWEEDIAIRRQVTGRPASTLDWRSFPAPQEPSIVWQDDVVTVSAVTVAHEPVEPAVGYRLDCAQGSVVISGDTRVCEEIESLAHGADVLVHEACLPEFVKKNVGASVIGYHADCRLLGAMAERAGVPVLMLTHLLPQPSVDEVEQAFEQEARDGGFTGRIVVGRDLVSVSLPPKR